MLQNIKKLNSEKNLVEKNFRKKSHNAEKNKGGPFGIFQHPFCRKTSKNWGGGGPLGSLTMSKKNWKGGDSSVSPGMVCYAEKENKTFLV